MNNYYWLLNNYKENNRNNDNEKRLVVMICMDSCEISAKHFLFCIVWNVFISTISFQRCADAQARQTYFKKGSSERWKCSQCRHSYPQQVCFR